MSGRGREAGPDLWLQERKIRRSEARNGVGYGVLTQNDEDAQDKEDPGDSEAPDSQGLVVCGPQGGKGG